MKRKCVKIRSHISDERSKSRVGLECV
uniref:Uncharacterized protein n=1 Tax=Anopheles albimanus TaxID=7167 RepID=A0A182FYH4_ANOAL